MRSFSVRTAPTITVCAASPNPVSCSTSPRACKPISPPCRRSATRCATCRRRVRWAHGPFSCGWARAPRPRRVARASRASRSTTISPSRSTPCWANNTPCRSADARGAAARRRRRRDVARFCVALCAVHIGHGDHHPDLRPAQRAHLSVSLSLAQRLHHAVEGREHLPAGAAIVLAKHQSAFETLAFQRIFPPQVWLLKRELLWVPFFGWGLAKQKPIAGDRKATRKALQQLLTIGGARLEHGRWVVIFPEGTRTAPGKKGRYAPGGAMLAARSGYPVVPVAHNAGEFWPRRGFIKRPGTIRIVIGPVIDSRGRSAQEINALAEVWFVFF